MSDLHTQHASHLHYEPDNGCATKDGGAEFKCEGHTFSPLGFFTAASMNVGILSGVMKGQEEGHRQGSHRLANGPQHFKARGLPPPPAQCATLSPSQAPLLAPVSSSTRTQAFAEHSRCSRTKGSVLHPSVIQPQWLCNQVGGG